MSVKLLGSIFCNMGVEITNFLTRFILWTKPRLNQCLSILWNNFFQFMCWQSTAEIARSSNWTYKWATILLLLNFAYDTTHWWLFTDSSKTRLKAVLLNNKLLLVLVGYDSDTRETNKDVKLKDNKKLQRKIRMI